MQTMDSDSHVFKDGAVAIRRETIVDVGHSLDILSRFSGSDATVADLHGQILLPGFVNTHVHTSQQLGRGIAGDVDLMTWLHGRIWPYESSMTEEDSYVSTLLCGVELICSGDLICRGWRSARFRDGPDSRGSGLRACLARSVMDCGEGLPVSWASETAQDCMEVGGKFPLPMDFHVSKQSVTGIAYSGGLLN